VEKRWTIRKKENTDYLTDVIRKLEDLLNGVLVHYHDEERLKIIIELYNFLDRKWGKRKGEYYKDWIRVAGTKKDG